VKGYQIILAVIALALAWTFCLRPPAFPRWDSTLNVPLYQNTFRLVDFLDSTRFQIQSDSTINFACEFPIDTVTPEGVIGLVSMEESNRIGLSDFIFTNVPGGVTGMGIEDLLGMPVPDSGLKQKVDAFERTLMRECSFPGVASAEVVYGIMRTTVSNRTGLPIDSVVIHMPFGQVRFDQVRPRTSQSSQTEMGGVYISSPMSLIIAVGSPGTGPDTLRLAKSDSFLVEVTVDSLQVSSARAKILKARGRRRYRVAARSSQPFKIDSMVLGSGVCRIVLSNDFGVPLEARLMVPKLGKNKCYHIQAHSSTMAEMDLSGIRVDNKTRTNSLLDFDVVAIPDSSDELVDLNKQDGLTVCYETRQLEPDRVAGEFQQPVYVVSVRDTLPKFVPAGAGVASAFGKNVAVGVAGHCLWGLAYAELSEAEAHFITTPTVVASDGILAYRTAKAGNGFSFDLGVVYWRNDWRFTLACLDIGPGITWTEGIEEGVYAFSLDSANVYDITTKGLFVQSFDRHPGSEFTTRLPLKLNLAAGHTFYKWLNSGLMFQGRFGNSSGWQTTGIVEVQPWSWLPLGWQLSYGRPDAPSLGLRAGLVLNRVVVTTRFDCLSGFLFGAKGVNLGIGVSCGQLHQKPAVHPFLLHYGVE